MLQIERLSVNYGAVAAVHEVFMEVHAGEVVALVGANGAGKSSILKGLLGLAPSNGTIKIDGIAVQFLPTHARVAAGMALSPEGRFVFASMSVLENLELGQRTPARNSVTDRFADMFSLFPVLEERRNQMAGNLSGGEQQMLAIARALMSDPKILMLDEPTLGLAPIVVAELSALLDTLRKRGLAVLLAEQNAEIALESSNRAYVLETGTIVQSGNSRELADDAAIRKAYLGM